MDDRIYELALAIEAQNWAEARTGLDLLVREMEGAQHAEAFCERCAADLTIITEFGQFADQVETARAHHRAQQRRDLRRAHQAKEVA